MTSSASILTILAFTVERYMAICHPMKAQTMSNLNRSVKVIVAIWVTACVISVPFPIHTRAFYYLRDPVTSDYVGESLVCSIPLEWMPAMKVIFQLYTFVLFVVPMLAMIGLYVFIGVALRKSQLASHSFRNTRSSTHLYSRRAVVKILGTSTGSRDFHLRRAIFGKAVATRRRGPPTIMSGAPYNAETGMRYAFSRIKK